MSSRSTARYTRTSHTRTPWPPCYNAALGLIDVNAPLDRLPTPDRRKDQIWVASRMVPFSSRMVTERLECVRVGKSSEAKVRGGADARVLMNDEAQPLESCGGEKGLCTLEAFVQSQEYARTSGDGDFKFCYD